MKSETDQLNYATERICNVLKREGVHILKYVSPAYHSTYLKFDYGMGNSLRLATHRSKKKHLDYKFNYLLNVEEIFVDESGKYPKHFYGPKHLDVLIDDIKLNIKKRKNTYGSSYIKFMNKNIEESKNNPFWKKAEKV